MQDFRYALRTLWQRPGFAAVVLLTLALGSGATTVMFTVVNGVLLKPLPYAQPSRLVTLQEKTEKPNAIRISVGVRVPELSGLQTSNPHAHFDGGLALRRRNHQRGEWRGVCRRLADFV